MADANGRGSGDPADVDLHRDTPDRGQRNRGEPFCQPRATFIRPIRDAGPVARRLLVVPLLGVLLAWGEYTLQADSPPTREKPAAEAAVPSGEEPPAAQPEEPLKLPEGWPEGHPLPRVRSNCMVCHLNAGRELTLAVHDFSRSTHDLQEMSCSDCHGGNTADDTTAHDSEFHFIGTKLSGLLAKCSECHDEPAKQLAEGPHHWDFQKRINTKYPMCLDCHGNHDVGNPPDDFALKSVCQDCHDDFDQAFPGYASVMDQNDRLWQTLGTIRREGAAESLPKEIGDEIGRVRHRTMHLIHSVQPLDEAQAQALNAEAESLRGKLEKWLAEADQPSASTAGNPAGGR